MIDYVVTLRSFEELDAFYNDMETAGGPSTCPQREVTCCCKRPCSRNTDYMLEPEEVVELLKDERVIAVTPNPRDNPFHKIEWRGGWTQQGADSDKSQFINSNFVNWGMLRAMRQEQIPGWGSNGTQSVVADIQATSAGNNVDVVICDGYLEADNPQIAENADGTGNSRMVQENWGAFRPQVDGGAAFTFTYTTGQANLNNGGDNHGIHVSGTVCGQSQGYAREANIYNICPYGGAFNPNAANGVAGSVCYDYVRVWHNQKATNPDIGMPNPTIVNNSWGSSWSIPISLITSVTFQGVVNAGPFTQAQLEGFGFTTFFTFTDGDFAGQLGVNYEDWDTAVVTDVEDCINDGIIMVGAAGNSSYLIDVPGGANYDNLVTWQNSGQTINHFYHRGSSNVTGGTAIVVGAMDDVDTDRKVNFSMTGPRIDIWAPGTEIMSSVAGGQVQDNPPFSIATVPDALDNNFNLTKYDGTSMASPQVCGVLACYLELNPRANQEDCNRYLTTSAAGRGQLDPGTNGGFQDQQDLQGAPRDVLIYPYQRPSAIRPVPGNRTLTVHDSNYARPAQNVTNMLYPRTSALLTPQGGNQPGGWTGTITLTSPDFADGAALDNQFWFADLGCPGANDSPALTYSVAAGSDAIPAGATWTINCTDLDGGPFLHWSVTNIPSFYRNIQQNENFSGAAGSTPQPNDWGNPGESGNRANGWGGPCPPGGTGLHRYQFQVTLVDDQGTTLGTSNVYTSEITA